MAEKYPAWFDDLAQKHKAEAFKSEADILAFEPQLFKRYLDHISKRVKHDKPTKTLVFLTGLSAYTPDPINLFLRGPSSIGKTYNVTQTLLSYFPPSDVWMLGGLSPTALVHDYGTLVDQHGEPVDFTEKPSHRKPRKYKNESSEDYELRLKEWQQAQKKWREKLQNARYIVDLHRKILVFLEAPHHQTYNRLRPILSHDKEEISYKFTDKTPGGLRTMHVVLSGWPACIFNSTKEEYVEDLATRSFTVTPETTSGKLRAAVEHTGEKKAVPWKFHRDAEEMLLNGYVGWLKFTLENLTVAIPYASELAKHYPVDLPRCMRDFDHVLSLIEVSALFHCHQRPVLKIDDEKTVLATMKDLELVAELIPQVEETTLTGLPGHILEFFHKVVEPLYEDKIPFNYQELTDKYNDTFHGKKSSSTLRRYIMLLGEIGYVDTMDDPNDKRKALIMVIRKEDENTFLSVIHRFSSSFSLETFKTWFSAVKNSVHEKHVILMPKLSENHDADVETVYNQHYLPTLLDNGFLSVDKQISQYTSEPKESLEELGNRVDMCFTEKNAIPKTLSIQETLVLLRGAWHKGVYNDFDELVMQTRGCTREEAEQLREKWLDEGLVAYDPEGWLVWV